MTLFTGYRVEVVPDDDTDADPRIPKSVLEALRPDEALMGPTMMYIRRTLWERMKKRFKLVQQ